MSIVKNLSPIKKRFFESIGIYTESDIPSSFNEKILHLSSVIDESEKFCLEDYNICFNAQSMFAMKDLVGTDHDRYAGKTWLEAFLDLDRGDENLELLFANPNYYADLVVKGRSTLGIAKKDGKYYILAGAGGGNNRLIIMKLKYLAAVNRLNADRTAIDEEYTFLGNVRWTPSKTTADNIFYLVFPDGGYEQSGYYAINKSDTPDLELYDIVSGYPCDTKVVASSVLGEEISRIELQDLQRKLK